MKQYRTLLLALLAVLALTVCALADGEGDEPVTDTVVEVADQTVEIVSDPDAPQDNDELFYEYMLRLAREQMTPARPTREPTRDVHEQEMGLRSGGADGSRPPANIETAGSKLPAKEKGVYNKLKQEIKKIASGTLSSTTISITAGEMGYTVTSWNFSQYSLSADNPEGKASELLSFLFDFDLDAVIDALLADMPYELYWYNKTAGVSASTNYSYSYTDTSASIDNLNNIVVTISFAVAREYGGNYSTDKADSYDEAYTITTPTAARVTAAVNNANSIVTTNATKSDYEKLVAYKETICNAVTYDSAALTASAAAGNKPAITDPWQLINAFDTLNGNGSDGTNIVCEGYSKAFKYLCDLSTFEGDVQCYLVTGDMIGGTGAGAHMWNIVTLDGKNYLVDVTNCDGNEFTKTDALFLKGITEASSISFSGKDYVIDFYATVPQQWANHEHTSFYPEHNVAYKYAEDTVWRTAKPEILTLSTTDYTPPTINYTAGPTGGNYSYCAEGTTLHLKPTSGTAYLILARYSSGKLVEVKVQEVSTECSIENMTVSTEWKIFSVNGMDTCVPQGAALPLEISNN